MLECYKMAIEKYTTPAFVIAMYPSGEDDVIIKAYTRDFGMINIKSQSLRKSVKLRGHIGLHKLCQVTVVKGKEIYRLTGVVEMQKDTDFIPHICECVGKFIHGEGKNVKLFDRLMAYCEMEKKDYDVALLRVALYADVLIQLGYLDIEELSMSKTEYINCDVSHIYLLSSLNKKHFVNTIQKSIASSML